MKYCGTLTLLYLSINILALFVENISASWNLTAAVEYSNNYWNCDGSKPPCEGCKTVQEGSEQFPYGCAPYIAHILSAGGMNIGCGKCGSIDCFDDVVYNGKHYSLNYVAKEDASCDDDNYSGCLMDFLLAKGWEKVSRSEVDKGVVCAVDGGSSFDEPWGHIVFGVAPGLINAHNVARYHQTIDVYNNHIHLCLKHP